MLTGADAPAPYGGAAFHDNKVWVRLAAIPHFSPRGEINHFSIFEPFAEVLEIARGGFAN